MKLFVTLIALALMLSNPVFAQDIKERALIDKNNILSLSEITVFEKTDNAAQHTDLEFSPDSKYLIYDTTFQMAATRLEGSIYVWQLNPLVEMYSVKGSLQGFVDESTFSSCFENHTQNNYVLQSGKLISERNTRWCGTLNSPAHLIATSEGYDFYLHIRDFDTGEILVSSKVPAVWKQFSSDGSLLATSSILDEIAVWNVDHVLELGHITIDDAFAIMPHQGVEIGSGGDIAFSPDNRFLIYSSLDGLYAWDVQQQKLVAELGDNFRADAIEFSPNGELIVTGTRGEDIVRIWDAKSWLQIADLPIVQVTDVAFSPDGTLLGFGQTNGSVSLWGMSNDKD